MIFRKKDILFNVLEAYPSQKFLIYQNSVYYRNQTGLNDTPEGHIDLYELNVNRTSDKIYPFITKASTRGAFSTVSNSPFAANSQFNYGDVIQGSYPMTASISRVHIPQGTEFAKFTFVELYSGDALTVNKNKKYITSLRNTLSYYTRMSRHFSYESNIGDLVWNKGTQELNLISIPSIFFGNSIKKTSVKLGFYLSGTLVAELTDRKGDGELIQTTGPAASSEKVGGVVMYDHGFMILTGSWDLDDTTEEYDGNATDTTPKWTNFAIGLRDPEGETPGVNIPSASYSIDFQGVNPISTLTMFAHARKTEFNISSNPTFVEKTTTRASIVNNKIVYHPVKIKNVAKSNYKNYEENYEEIVYISKIGIYDAAQNLLAVASLANPVKKIKGRDYTFKLKLDI